MKSKRNLGQIGPSFLVKYSHTVSCICTKMKKVAFPFISRKSKTLGKQAPHFCLQPYQGCICTKMKKGGISFYFKEKQRKLMALNDSPLTFVTLSPPPPSNWGHHFQTFHNLITNYDILRCYLAKNDVPSCCSGVEATKIEKHNQKQYVVSV